MAKADQNKADDDRYTLSVSGTGRVEIPTSTAEVRLGVVVDGKTADDAHAAAAKRAAEVVKQLKRHKVEKLETTRLRLNPQYAWDGKKRVLQGYQARNSISFRVPVEKSGPLMDELVRAGATEIEGVRFIPEDDALDQGRQQALQAAAKDARQQADAVLAALGLKAVGIRSIRVGGAATPSPRPMKRFAAAADAEAAVTPVEAAEQEIRANVTLIIEYEPGS